MKGGFNLVADTVVGGKGSRSVKLKSIDDMLVTLEAKYSLPMDAMCCPSGEGEAIFFVTSRGKIRELNVSPKMP